MTSRHSVTALSKVKPEHYERELNFLQDFIKIFQTMQIGGKMSWKPSQTRALISTWSILDIQNVLLADKRTSFF